MDNLLWSEEEIKVSADGFLLIVNPEAYLLNEEQPLLLHTTVGLLQALYPSLGIHEIFLRSGFESEEVFKDCLDGTVTRSESTSVEEPKSIPLTDKKQETDNGHSDVKAGKASPPAKYKIYQKLDRVENLSNRINSTLQDIRNFRNRVNGSRSDSTRENEKITALRFQHIHPLQTNSEINGGNSKIGNQNETYRRDQGEQKSKSEACAPADGDRDDTDNVRFEEESIIIKLTRTINSIRALFPHLLPILNHLRRNDKNLVVGKIRYKTKRNGPMCWLLGTESFSSCTLKQIVAAQDDAKEILEAFIDIELASEISKDPEGSPSYWATSWINHILKRSNPTLLSPMKVLATKSGTSEEDIAHTARKCDTIICARDKASTQGFDQHYKRAVRKIHQRLSNVLTSRFQGARLSIYGSCLSNLSLGKGSDVDMSLWIPAADSLKKGLDDGSVDARQYEQSMKKLVYQVFRKLSNLKAEFRGMTPITKARIPVITGTYIYAENPFTEDGSIDFDICFLNDIAVANSNLLRDYSLVDPRGRSLMLTVKQWAKEQKIDSAKEKCISSYSWMNLVVFYLQCIGFLPNLQSPALMKAVGLVPDRDRNYWHFINNLDTCTLKWDEVKRGELWSMPCEFDDLPLSLLVYGFFEFYSSRFPFGTHAVSIRRANISLSKLATKKVNYFLSIEDPFETYDSHCPHDLGTPANAYGSTKIMNCLRDAEDHLRMVLCSEKINEERLWPKPQFVEPEPTRNNAKKSGFTRFERPMCVINDNPDSNVTNQDKPAEHTMNGMGANHNQQKRHQAGRARGRGTHRGRNDRAKAKKDPKTS